MYLWPSRAAIIKGVIPGVVFAKKLTPVVVIVSEHKAHAQSQHDPSGWPTSLQNHRDKKERAGLKMHGKDEGVEPLRGFSLPSRRPL